DLTGRVYMEVTACFFSSRRRHTRFSRDWSSDVCSSDLPLTKDHKPNWPEEYQRIMALGGKVEFDGYDYRVGDLSVSRAFGDIDRSEERRVGRECRLMWVADG